MLVRNLKGDCYVGREIGEVLSIGRGAVVYQAHHTSLERPEVVKQATREARPERFSREARILAQLDTPHVVAVYDSLDPERDDRVEDAGRERLLFLEYVAGETLSELRAAAPVAIDLAVRLDEGPRDPAREPALDRSVHARTMGYPGVASERRRGQSSPAGRRLCAFRSNCLTPKRLGGT